MLASIILSLPHVRSSDRKTTEHVLECSNLVLRGGYTHPSSSSSAMPPFPVSMLHRKVWKTTPEYYRAPFHCYPEGNLCWQAALEVEPSALSVHANIYTTKGEFEAEGDDRLRSNFHQRMREMLRVSEGLGQTSNVCRSGGGGGQGGWRERDFCSCNIDD